MYIVDEIIAKLPFFHYWDALPDGVLLREYTLAGDHVETLLPYAFFAEMHPDLPLLLQHRVRSLDETNIQLPSTGVMYAQIRDVIAPLVLPIGGNIRCSVYYFEAITWDPGAQHVTLIAAICNRNRAHHLHNSPALPYVVSVNTEDIDVPLSTMDSVFPGWRDRLALGQGLGYDGIELADYVLDPPALKHRPAVDLPAECTLCL